MSKSKAPGLKQKNSTKRLVTAYPIQARVKPIGRADFSMKVIVQRDFTINSPNWLCAEVEKVSTYLRGLLRPDHCLHHCSCVLTCLFWISYIMQNTEQTSHLSLKFSKDPIWSNISLVSCVALNLAKPTTERCTVPFPLYRTESTSRGLEGKKVFTKLILVSGFNIISRQFTTVWFCNLTDVWKSWFC